MAKGILSTITGTPLVKLDRLFKNVYFELFGKLEFFNPGGSIKGRSALKIIETALERGELQPGMTVIESSSGNMGIGLAQIWLAAASAPSLWEATWVGSCQTGTQRCRLHRQSVCSRDYMDVVAAK